MIFTTIKHLKRYKNLNQYLDIAIDYICENQLNDLPLGKTIIKGDDVFVNVMDYLADNKEDAFFEAHQNYLDIHMVISGKEKMTGIILEEAKTRLTYDSKNDIEILDGHAQYECIIENESCLIVFPEDAHLPKIHLNNENVRKVVFKVKL